MLIFLYMFASGAKKFLHICVQVFESYCQIKPKQITNLIMLHIKLSATTATELNERNVLPLQSAKPQTLINTYLNTDVCTKPLDEWICRLLTYFDCLPVELITCNTDTPTHTPTHTNDNALTQRHMCGCCKQTMTIGDLNMISDMFWPMWGFVLHGQHQYICKYRQMLP